MFTLLIAVASFVLYIIAYNTYGRWLSRRLFGLDSSRPTPAVVRNDGTDFVPSPRGVVFGHHFTSIAGTGPIVGPAIAVIWGWLPALLWVLIGSIFVGAVHDLGALVMSLRNQGRTIGDFCGDIVNRRVRLLFLVIILFALWIVIAIFGLVIATLFTRYPQSVLSVWLEIPLAIGVGILVSRGSRHASLLAALAVLTMYVGVWLGGHFPALQLVFATTQAQAAEHLALGRTVIEIPFLSSVGVWTLILLVYAFIASVLPVQHLLQPRDYLNAHQLMIAMGALGVALVIARPEMVAPAVDLSNPSKGTPGWLPLLFITVACGACSGFHCLVSSGCSSKQLRSEGDAQAIGFGSMLLEGMLAVLVILACTAGVGMHFNVGGVDHVGREAWSAAYPSWNASLKMLAPFVEGSANILGKLPFVTREFAVATMGVFVASFASTTLDTTTRLQRYVITELGNTLKIGPLRNAWLATGIAVVTGLVLAMWDALASDKPLAEALKTGGAGAMALWPLFGAVNQLLAGLALLILTVWLHRKGKPVWPAAVPMVFMLAMTGWALALNVQSFLSPPDGSAPKVGLAIVGAGILLLQAWMVVEAALFVWRSRRDAALGRALPELVESA